MIEYTPTLEQMRNIYITFRMQEHQGNDKDEFDFQEEFYRWHEEESAQQYVKGVEAVCVEAGKKVNVMFHSYGVQSRVIKVNDLTRIKDKLVREARSREFARGGEYST